jgi:hypothetical protein
LAKKSRRRHQPTDPAEIARRKKEREAYTRRTPSEWGANEDALTLESNADVHMTGATREKTARIQRYDCFVTLGIAVDAYTAVRRYQDDLAIRYGCEGAVRLEGKVDGTGSAELVSARSLEAADRLDDLSALMPEPWMLPLIEALSLPAVVKGERINWKAIVRSRIGLIDRDAQARAVKISCEGLRRAYVDYDNGQMRRAA